MCPTEHQSPGTSIVTAYKVCAAYTSYSAVTASYSSAVTASYSSVQQCRYSSYSSVVTAVTAMQMMQLLYNSC